MAARHSHEAAKTSIGSEAGTLSRKLPRAQGNTHALHQLQRVLGNRALQRLIQAKLRVGSVDDVHEQEADRVARHVAGMPSVEASHSSPLQISKVSEADAAGTVEAGPDLERQLDGSAGKGSPLPDHLLGFMEAGFHTDFSQVRLHTDHEAAQLSEALGAQAFTVGNDIYYGSGESPSDLELTAHELTHVVQQGGGVQAEPAPAGSAAVAPGHSLARRMIHRRGHPIPPGAIPTPMDRPLDRVDGARVVARLNEIAHGMHAPFEGFEGTSVEQDLINAFETANLQPRSIPIYFIDDRGLNMKWTGTVLIRIENPVPVSSGTGTITGGGGGTGTYGSSRSTAVTTGATVGASGGQTTGAAPAVSTSGVSVSGTTSTTDTYGTSVGGSGTATTGAEATHRQQIYDAMVVANIFLRCEPDFSESDYLNPFKWGYAGMDALLGARTGRGDTDCGRWSYMVSGGLAPAAPAGP